MLLQRHGAHGGVRHLRGGHRELHVRPARQLLGDLVVRRQRHAAHQVVRRVRSCDQRGKHSCVNLDEQNVSKWSLNSLAYTLTESKIKGKVGGAA